MALLLTGCAGFIGFHVARHLLDRGEHVIGIDNLDPYYDVALKRARLAQLEGRDGFAFHPVDVADTAGVTALVERHPDIDRIIHLAAQAGVRYSLTQPLAYVEANVKGQVVLLEAATPARPRFTGPMLSGPSASRTAPTIRCRSTPRPSAPAS